LVVVDDVEECSSCKMTTTVDRDTRKRSFNGGTVVVTESSMDFDSVDL
jgi:hypothetical protein